MSAVVAVKPLYLAKPDAAAFLSLSVSTFEGLVAARKEAIKTEIVAEGVASFAAHIRSLNAAMPSNYMPQVPADFGGCIKGLRTIDSIRNAVDTELANAKIRANEIANRIHANVKTLQESGLVVHDAPALVLKQPDDLAAVIAQRKASEQARLEAERERIRAEEAARLEREAKAEADRVERERARAAQVEAQRIAREQAEAASAARIHDELIASASKPLTATEVAEKVVQTMGLSSDSHRVSSIDIEAQEDDGERMTLGQINERLAPVSITVAGLSMLGYEPVAVVKAARMYRASDFRHICAAISAHVLAAPVKALEAA